MNRKFRTLCVCIAVSIVSLVTTSAHAGGDWGGRQGDQRHRPPGYFNPVPGFYLRPGPVHHLHRHHQQHPTYVRHYGYHRPHHSPPVYRDRPGHHHRSQSHRNNAGDNHQHRNGRHDGRMDGHRR